MVYDLVTMKTLVVYDSLYGNTEKIAQAIGSVISGEVNVISVKEGRASLLSPSDKLIIGSPTHGGRPTPPIVAFIDAIPPEVAKSIKVAAFDTRIPGRFIKIFKYAADKIAQSLQAKGAGLISPPEGFLVEGTKGPLISGEYERAKEWGRRV